MGYLTNPMDWNERLATAIALQDGIELTDSHWEVIYFLRSFYREFHTYPAVRIMVKAIAQKYGAEKGNSSYLFRLFPQGPAKQATKIAGLPKPVKCL